MQPSHSFIDFVDVHDNPELEALFLAIFFLLLHEYFLHLSIPRTEMKRANLMKLPTIRFWIPYVPNVEATAMGLHFDRSFDVDGTNSSVVDRGVTLVLEALGDTNRRPIVLAVTRTPWRKKGQEISTHTNLNI